MRSPRSRALSRLRAPTGMRTVALTALLLLPATTTPGPSSRARAQDADPLQPTIRLLAADGDPIAGRPGAFLDGLFDRDAIAITQDGVGLFDGQIDDAGGSTLAATAYFRADGVTVESVFAAGDAAPAAGIATGGATIDNVRETFTSPDGDVLANVDLVGGTIFGEALVASFRGGSAPTPPATVIAARNVGFGGICGFSDLGNGISTGQFAVNGEFVALHAVTHRDLCGDSLGGVYRTTSAGGNLETLVLEEGVPPGLPGAEFHSIFWRSGLNPQGACLFSGTATGVQNVGNVGQLLLAEPGKSLIVVTQSGAAVPGYANTQTGIARATLGATPGDGSLPRIAYAASGENDALFVFDSAAGAGPVLARGMTVDGFTFDAGPNSFAGSDGFHIAAGDVLVAVGDTTGNGLATGAEAVWRHDADATKPLQVVLYEGGPVPGTDPRATNQTLTRLFTVHVNQQGRIACEADIGNLGQCILMEDSDPAKRGQFHIVVARRDTLPFRNGTARATGLLGQLPTTPRMLGPGHDGRQTRFNDRGEFVFRGFMDPDDGSSSRSALYSVSTDPPPEMCDVEVRRKGKNLLVRGGESGCDLTVRSLADGDFEFVPGTDTTVNGETRTLALDGIFGKVTIQLGDGNDTLRLESTELSCDQNSVVDVASHLSISTGGGADSIRLDEFEIKGNLLLDLGNDGIENLQVDDTCVGGSLVVTGGKVQAVGRFETVQVGRNAKFQLPGGPPDELAPGDWDFVSCAFHHVAVKGSPFPELIRFDRCDITGNVKIDTNSGVLEDVRLNETLVEGAVRIKAKKAGMLVARLSDLRVPGSGLRIDTGKNGCTLNIEQCEVGRDLVLVTGGAEEGNRNDIGIDNSIIEQALILKGKGPQDLAVVRGTSVEGGIAINSKGGPLDQFVINDVSLSDGHITIKSRAENLFSRLAGLTLENGDIRFRGTNGKDTFIVEDSDVNGTVQAILGKGDDELLVRGVTVLRNLRLFGGPGTDLVNSDAATANGVSDETVINDFEGDRPAN